MGDYYRSLSEASLDPDQKVAWCSSVGPVEILVAMGFKVYFPENHGALIGAKKLSSEFITAANSLGYSPEVCSYLTSDIGAFVLERSPLQNVYGIAGPPRPDVLVFNTNQCREIQDWFAFYSEQYKVPSLGIFSPWRLHKIRKADIAHAVAQYNDLIEGLEEVTTKKIDWDFLKQVIRVSGDCSREWRKFLEYSKNSPSPITFFDACIHMAPIVLMRGEHEALDYYRTLNKEMATRVKEGMDAGDAELCRFYWEGMPVWGRLRFLADLFEKVNSSVVASTYCNSWVFDDLDPDSAIESMAKSYLEIFINRDERTKEKMLVKMAKEYSVDAIIFHDAKTCPHNTNAKFGMPERIQKKYGIPTLTVYGDLNDMRCFSDEQTSTVIQAFMENFKRGRS